MGTVRPYRLPIATDGAVYQAVSIIEERIRTFKVASLRSRIIDKARLHLPQHVNVAFHLQIAVAVIRETGMPCFVPPCPRAFVPTKNIGIIVGTPRLFLIHQTICCQRLAGSQLQPLASLALNGDFRKAGEVLTHVEHKDGILAHSVLDPIALHDFYRLRYLLAEYALRHFLNDYRPPKIPSLGGVGGGFQPGIIVLTAINAVKCNG